MPSPFRIPKSEPPIPTVSNTTMPTCPIRIDGSDQDLALSTSTHLTRPEVLARRARRIKQLSQIYRDHYWALVEEIRLKCREYWWEYGKSPFLDEKNNNNNNNGGSNDHFRRVKDEKDDNSDGENGVGVIGGCSVGNMCVVQGCKAKAMALTSFCHMHIVLDVRQRLYKTCMFPVKRFSAMSGPIECGKPILKATVPPYCDPHYQKAEKHMLRALKRAGLNTTSTNKVAPKFHVIIAEYVRQIQNNRRAAASARRVKQLENAVVIKEETNN